MEFEKQTILDRIVKMMLLAKDQEGTPEGETAKNMAFKIMQKFRIDETELDLDNEDCLVDDGYQVGIDKGGKRQWIIDLSGDLAHVFDCKTYHYSYSMDIHFVGTGSDVETCVYFLAMIYGHIEREAWKMFPAESRWKSRNEFGTAAQEVVWSRLSAMKQEMDKAVQAMAESCTDLVIRKAEMVAESYDLMIQEKGWKMKTSKRNDVKVRNQKTLEAGREAGRTAPLNRGITQ